ncbi:class I SAM-dependent methyltransferase [Pseudomonas protegens]|uniref:class I SAM-dependent methyltransferase n=1 Tax=Pseudomonas TaxID=286 RepID=UPI00320A6380
MVKRIHWTPQLVSTFWDGVAQTELDNLSFGKVAGPDFIELISKFLVPGGRHLDFGAGSGHVLQILLDRGLNAAGFDPSPDRQALLLDKIGGHQNFLGVQGADSNEQYDVVLLMEVIEHILDDDFQQVLERVAMFVKPGGSLIVSTPNNENLETASVYCPVSDTFFHPWQHVRSFTPDKLSGCLAGFGFTSEFIALADFSADAEALKLQKAGVVSKAQLAQLNEAVKLAVKECDLQRQELDKIDDFLGSRVNLSVWQKIKIRIKLLFQFRKKVSELHSIAHAMSYRLNEVSTDTLRVLGTVLENNDESPLVDAPDGINLRIGRETTIVYVGRKI